MSARIGRTAVGLETERGFHNPGTQGPLAAAVAVGSYMGWIVTALSVLLGIAGSSSAGCLSSHGTGQTPSGFILAERANSVRERIMPGKDLAGRQTYWKGRYGYYNAFSLPANMEKLLDGIGQRGQYSRCHSSHILPT